MRRSSGGHTRCTKGKKVILHMRDGTKLIGKFDSHTDRFIRLQGVANPIRTDDIRTMTIWRGDAAERRGGGLT